MGEVVHRELADVTNIIQAIERAALNPDVDVEKMERLLAMQERILDRQAKQAFDAAMNRAQAKMPVVAKNRPNEQTNSRYADVAKIVETCRPIWTAEGFAMSFGEADCPHEHCVRVECEVSHEAGHSKTYHRDVPIDDKGIKGSVNKTATHASASSVTYARRYLTCLAFNIATDDDIDGNSPVTEAIFISDDQANALDAMITENALDREGFMSWLKTKGIESLGEIPNDGSFDVAKRRLEKMVANSRR